MDENLLSNLKAIIESDNDLTQKIATIMQDAKNKEAQNALGIQSASELSKKQELLENFLPFLDEKSARITAYIIAAMKISNIITELKNKFS